MFSRQPLPNRPRRRSLDVKLEAGGRVEAQDSFRNWYPARIVEVDEEDKEVQIHFEGWNQRHDEWLPFDSDRLRSTSLDAERRRQSRKKVFDVGAKVEVKWKNFGYYPAVILDRRDNDMYHIRFDDNVKATVTCNSIRDPKNSTSSFLREEKERQEKLAKERYHRALKRRLSDATLSEPSASRQCHSVSSVSGPDDVKHQRPSAQTPVSETDSESDDDDSDEDEDEELDVFDEELCVPKKAKIALPSPQAMPVVKEEKEEEEEEESAISLPLKDDSVPSVVPMMNTEPTSDSAEAPPAEAPPETSLGVQLPAVQPPICPPERKRPFIKKSNRVDPLVTRSKISKFAAPREFVVLEDHNMFKCYHPGCEKSFRKEAGMDAHVKYYHHETDASRKKNKLLAAKRQLALKAAQKAKETKASALDVNTSLDVPSSSELVNTQKSALEEKKASCPKVPFQPRILEVLKPSHLQAWKRFKHSYNWHELGRLPGTKTSADEAKAAIMACRHDVISDLIAMERVLKGLDMRISLAENPKDELIKVWMPNVKRSTPVENTGDTSPARKTAESTTHVTVVPYDLSDTSDDDEEKMLSSSSPQAPQATGQGSSSQERRPSSSSGTLYNDSEGEMGDNGDGTETESQESIAQMRILDEIDRIHDELEDRLDFLEEQLQALDESGDPLVAQ
eukprot:m.223360 g.223360  ORF g.223360 m.223360 type:complete len:678 (+) comp39981_c1_seq38:54-2087(+)